MSMLAFTMIANEMTRLWVQSLWAAYPIVLTPPPKD
jgi:hypothetical protein